MLDFFQYIADTIHMAVDFLIGIVKNTITLIETLNTSVQSFGLIMGWAPSVLAASATLCLGVVVLNYIVGRSNQS